MDPSADTISSVLAEVAARRKEADFILEGDATISFRGLQAAAARAAAGLSRLDLQRGDRIGLLSLNRIEWLVLFFAAMRLGVAVVAMSPRYRERELGYMVGDSGLKAVATMNSHEGHDFPAMFDRLAPEHPGLRQLILFDPAKTESPRGSLQRVSYQSLLVESRPPDDAAHADELAMVIYTSGTTGRPKGAGLTHASLLASARAQAQHMRIDEHDLLPLASPLNHVGGITCGILSFLCGGGAIDLMAEFKAHEMLERIRRHRPSVLAGVPTMMTLILMKSEGLDIDFSSVRLLFCGGSNVDAALIAQLEARMPNARLMNLYGLSESSGAIVLTPWDATREDLMSAIGRPIGDAQVRVVDPVSGAPLPVGEVGELSLRGCGVVPGYIGAARENAAFEPGGWLRTGDLGTLDGRGVITLKGRAKDMFIQGGFNVYPAEVEAHIALHPQVLMVAGIGVADPVLGEIGRYYVVRREGASTNEAELRAWCAESLADYKVPRQFVFRDELPLTPAGKIHKAALRIDGGKS